MTLFSVVISGAPSVISTTLPCHPEPPPVIPSVVEGSKKYIMTQDEKMERDEHDMLNWLKYAIVCH